MWLSGGRASVLSDWSFIQCGLIGKRGERSLEEVEKEKRVYMDVIIEMNIC